MARLRAFPSPTRAVSSAAGRYSVAWKRYRQTLIAAKGPNSGCHCTSPAFTIRSDARLAKFNPQTWPQNGVRELVYQTDNIDVLSNPMSLYVPLSKGTRIGRNDPCLTIRRSVSRQPRVTTPLVLHEPWKIH